MTCSNGLCSAQDNSRCDSGEICSGGSCVSTGCTSDSQCSGSTPRCNTATGQCVQCNFGPDCDDGNPCTVNECSNSMCSSAHAADGSACGSGQCVGGSCVTPECATDADCGDSNPCTINTCVSPGLANASCTSTPVGCSLEPDGCCPDGCAPAEDADCQACSEHSDCSSGLCCGFVCRSTECSADADCSTGNPCVSGSCENPGSCNASCLVAPVSACINGDGCCPAGCSVIDSDCVTGCDFNTAEACSSGGCEWCPQTSTCLESVECTAGCSGNRRCSGCIWVACAGTDQS